MADINVRDVLSSSSPLEQTRPFTARLSPSLCPADGNQHVPGPLSPGQSLSCTALSGVGPGTVVLTSPGGVVGRDLVSFVACSQAPALAAVMPRTWSVDVTCGDCVRVCVISLSGLRGSKRATGARWSLLSAPSSSRVGSHSLARPLGRTRLRHWAPCWLSEPGSGRVRAGTRAGRPVRGVVFPGADGPPASQCFPGRSALGTHTAGSKRSPDAGLQLQTSWFRGSGVCPGVWGWEAPQRSRAGGRGWKQLPRPFPGLPLALCFCGWDPH